MYTRGLFLSFCIAHTLERRDRISFYGCDMRSTTAPCASYWCAAVTSHGGLRAHQANFRGTYRLSIRRLAQTWRAREGDDGCQCCGDRARNASDKADIGWRCAGGLACPPQTRTQSGHPRRRQFSRRPPGFITDPRLPPSTFRLSSSSPFSSEHRFVRWQYQATFVQASSWKYI